jgi:RimJ/RimL family protein N-acetyltransferase
VKVIETQRLLLEPLSQERLEEFVSLTADPETMCYWSPTGAFERDEAEHRFERALTRTRERGFGRRWIVLKATGDGIGFTETKILGEGFGDVAPDEVELGWMLMRSAWGNGYATEAGSAARDEAFRMLELDSVISMHHPENPASGRVMEKLGMKFERDLPDVHGWPSRLYRLSRTRWEELR